MSFGNRSKEQPDWLEPEELEEKLHQAQSVQKSGLGISLFDLAAAGALFAAVFAGAFYFLGGFSPATTQLAGTVPTLRGPHLPPIARSYQKDPGFPVVETPPTHVAFKMATTTAGFDAIDSELHEQCMKPASTTAARRAEARGDTILSAKTAAKFIACTMKIYTDRFCQPFYRQRLVKRLNAFLQTRRDHYAGLQPAGTDNNENPVPADFVPAPLGSQINALSTQGLLSASDFGIARDAPAEFQPYLAKALQQSCG